MELLLTGFFAAVLAGMGLGGGILLIPCLTLLLGFPQQQAQQLSLITYLPMAAAALFLRRGDGLRFDGRLAGALAFGALGAAGGALLSGWVDAALLRRIYGAFLILIGAVQFLSAFRAKGGPRASEKSGKK